MKRSTNRKPYFNEKIGDYCLSLGQIPQEVNSLYF